MEEEKAETWRCSYCNARWMVGERGEKVNDVNMRMD